MKPSLEYSLKNRADEIPRVEAWVREFAQRHSLHEPVRRALDLALAEWVTNIIVHGYRDDREHEIQLRFFAEAGAVRVEVEDDGIPFDPTIAPAPDITVPLDQRAIGGLGIALMRRMSEALEYRRQGGRNIVTLTKKIG